jgi:hypothetical protein
MGQEHDAGGLHASRRVHPARQGRHCHRPRQQEDLARLLARGLTWPAPPRVFGAARARCLRSARGAGRGARCVQSTHTRTHTNHAHSPDQPDSPCHRPDSASRYSFSIRKAGCCSKSAPRPKSRSPTSGRTRAARTRCTASLRRYAACRARCRGLRSVAPAQCTWVPHDVQFIRGCSRRVRPRKSTSESRTLALALPSGAHHPPPNPRHPLPLPTFTHLHNKHKHTNTHTNKQTHTHKLTNKQRHDNNSNTPKQLNPETNSNPQEVDTPADVADGSVMGTKRAAIRKLDHEVRAAAGLGACATQSLDERGRAAPASSRVAAATACTAHEYSRSVLFSLPAHAWHSLSWASRSRSSTSTASSSSRGSTIGCASPTRHPRVTLFVTDASRMRHGCVCDRVIDRVTTCVTNASDRRGSAIACRPPPPSRRAHSLAASPSRSDCVATLFETRAPRCVSAPLRQAADVVTHGPESPWGEHEIDYILFYR